MVVRIAYHLSTPVDRFVGGMYDYQATGGTLGPSPFGEYIKQRRLEAGLSLRYVAENLGVSHVYVGEVERGRRRSMPQEHWATLAKTIPGVLVEELMMCAEESAPLDPAEMHGQERDLVVALARRIRSRPLNEREVLDLMSILQKEGR